METVGDDWKEHHRQPIKEDVIRSFASRPGWCAGCKKAVHFNYIMCSSCVKIYCDACDEEFHLMNPLHNHRFLMKNKSVKALPTEFFKNGSSISKGLKGW